MFVVLVVSAVENSCWDFDIRLWDCMVVFVGGAKPWIILALDKNNRTATKCLGKWLLLMVVML